MTYELLASFIQKNSNCQPSTRRRHLSDFQIDDEHNQLHNPFQLGYITPFTHHSADAIHSFFLGKNNDKTSPFLATFAPFPSFREKQHWAIRKPSWNPLSNNVLTCFDQPFSNFHHFFIIFLHISSNISSSFVLFNPSSSYWCLVGNGLEWGEWDDYW